MKLRVFRSDTKVGAVVLRRALLHSSGGCCVSCGWSEDVGILHSHHICRDEKLGEIPALCEYVTRGVIDVEALLAEFARCESLCPTCHRLHHWVEQGSHPAGFSSVDELFTKIVSRVH